MDYPDDEDYEIISKKDIAALRAEIKQLREGGAPSESTVLSRLNQMLDLFKEASLSLKEEKPSSEKFDEINEKIDRLFEQNQQIAEGVVALADMIKSATEEKPEEIVQQVEQPKPMPQHMPTQMTNFNNQMPPPMSMPRQMQQGAGQMQPPLETPMPFPKPEMPSFNPLEGEELHAPGELPPLPQSPPKRRVLGF
jgi:hypothetical protein